jgi:hypothetical protein
MLRLDRKLTRCRATGKGAIRVAAAWASDAIRLYCRIYYDRE